LTLNIIQSMRNDAVLLMRMSPTRPAFEEFVARERNPARLQGLRLLLRTAQAGAVPIPSTASVGPAQPPMAAPAVAKGTVAAMPTPPLANPTPEPSAPPATDPTLAPTALMVPVTAVPAATTPPKEVAAPPVMATPRATFSSLDRPGLPAGRRSSTLSDI
jgi:hypothetical protein